MDLARYAKEYVDLQKRSYHNLFDTITLAQDCNEWTSNYWFKRIGLNESTQSAIEKWRSVLRRRRDASRRLIDSNYANMENYFTDIGN